MLFPGVSIKLATLLLLVGFTFPTQAVETLVICARVDGPPKHFVDAAGLPAGYATDIAAAVLREADFAPLIRTYPWKRAVDEAQKGNCVITGFSKTKQREVDYLFTDALYIDRVLLWAKADTPLVYESYKDLIGKRIGIARGSRYSEAFELNRSSLTLVEVGNTARLLQILQRDRVEAVIISGDLASVIYLSQRDGIDMSALQVADRSIAVDPNYLGVPKNLKAAKATDVVGRLDAAIGRMRANGSIDKILQQYR